VRKTKFKKKKRNAAGHLSGFESKVAGIYDEQKVPYEYETVKLPYVLPSPVHNYRPDFIVGPVYVEAKGYFPYKDQAKMRAVKAAHPEKDIRFVFMKPHALLPRRKVTHADWALAEGFPWTDLESLQAGIWRAPEGYPHAL